MHEIIAKTQLAPHITCFTVSAQRIAVMRRPGQFVIVRNGEGAERIPLAITDADPVAGTITLLLQTMGKLTRDLAKLKPGDSISSIIGPLGHPVELISSGYALTVSGGMGTAVIHPIAQGLSARGVQVISIIGGRTKDRIVYEDQLRRCGKVIVCTDDGSYGQQGNVTDVLSEVINHYDIGAVYAVGPVQMMQKVAEITRPKQIKTIISLNQIMIDGTGVCGGCRVSVDGKMKLACIEGPEFDGHLVDFDELSHRLSSYHTFESDTAAADHICIINR